ncbi:C4-dicarboxylate transporter DcuC [Sutterella megalosphaeroides]|uniref:Anaerobic C4-dicarboxylate transporter DcuC n=1 Tax=Sutterella megalosphaeroides TaxID=2494234 RepID=A0A2Z6I9W9_9BURK|nr:C4-dicarboxylate transporter DcuC [Sutterella megalosphaeroides]BBF23154.1 anaerobic C4-dicarboxylate transporter DcuC [Sutterella megalosphaeroides]
MTFAMWGALIVVIGTVWALIKRYETRLVLLTSGLLMTLLSLDPYAAFQQFDKSMTNGSLIIVICSSMGFAAVMTLTKCDLHLVSLLTKPLNKLGILLLPCTMVVTGVCSIAISSLAGLCAAIGPTMVALMIRAGFRPAVAAATVVASTLPSFVSPGSSHNGFVAKLADVPVMDFITYTAPRTAIISVVCIALMVLVCFLYGDFKKEGFHENNEGALVKQAEASELPENPKVLWALAPLLPVVILFVVSLTWPELKMSVATAMLIGMLYTLAVTRSDPADVMKKFFDGMGRGYGNILGLIIAAGVFAAGLRTCGVIDLFVEYLKGSSEIAKIGAAVGPLVLGIMTGSGDAAAFAFNEAVTVHAPEFGLTIPDLGYLAIVSATLGRVTSPIAAGMIVIAGIANVSPLDVVKRTAIANIGTLIVLYMIS